MVEETRRYCTVCTRGKRGDQNVMASEGYKVELLPTLISATCLHYCSKIGKHFHMTTKSTTNAGFYKIYRLTYDAPILVFCVVLFKTSL